jgi:hypothetical protein
LEREINGTIGETSGGVNDKWNTSSGNQLTAWLAFSKNSINLKN